MRVCKEKNVERFKSILQNKKHRESKNAFPMFLACPTATFCEAKLGKLTAKRATCDSEPMFAPKFIQI